LVSAAPDAPLIISTNATARIDTSAGENFSTCPVETARPVRSWQPGTESPETGELSFGGWSWRYDLAATGPSRTRVTPALYTPNNTGYSIGYDT
jgi:hypothetical protein